MKIGLTGGTGFIGSYFLREYADKYEIVAATSKDPSELPASLKSGVTFRKTDYSEGSFTEIFDGCDVIVHMGAKVPDRFSGFGSVSEYTASICSSEALLRAAGGMHASKFIDISSVAVYDKKTTPIKETDAYTPVNAYGISKAAVEIMAEAYAEAYGFRVISLRLSQVIGYRRWGRESFFGKLQEYPLDKRPIPVYGTGIHTRDIIYVKDVVRGVAAAIDSDRASGAYNLASGVGTSNLMLAQAFVQGYKSQSEIAFVPVENESTARWWCDTQKAERELDFRCRYDLVSMTEDIREEFIRDNGEQNQNEKR